MSKNFVTNKLRIRKKHLSAAIAFALMLSIAASTISIAPVTALIPTICSVSVSPKVQQVEQYVLVNAWITPQARFTGPPDIVGYSVYGGFYVNITKPDGTVDTFGPKITDEAATIYFTYIPTQTGNYSVTSYWNGDANHTGAVSPPFKFTVQEEPVPQWPASALPTGYWERPITGENREWYVLSGGWYNTGRNEGDEDGSCANPYSKAPDTAHILWALDTGMGGLIGGVYGSVSYGTAPAKLIMNGRAYFTLSDGTHCIDIRTGEEIWHVSTGGSLYLVAGSAAGAGGGGGYGAPYVWAVSGNNWVRLDANTGATTLTSVFNMVDPPGFTRARMVVDKDGYFYFHTYNTGPTAPVISGIVGRCVKWNSNTANIASNWSLGIVWNVVFADSYENRTKEHPMQVNGGIAVRDGLVWMNGNGGNTTTCLNATTGEVLSNTITTYWLQGFGLLLDGVGVAPSSWDRRVHGFNPITGQEIWQSEQKDYPWGAFFPYQMPALYGNFYSGGFDGKIYCIDAQTGKTVWKFYVGDSGAESPYDTWATYASPAIADGKLYMGTTEHSPTQPLVRGHRLYCLDAYNGTLLWSIAGCQGQLAIGDGALIASDGYTSNMYCFDKGQTTTTVSVKSDIVTQGSSVIIQGSVTDNSPAQPGTPAVSDESMTNWMEYLHMQRPMPTNTTGVEVTLNVLDSNNNFRPIGTATTDTTGFYSLMWTPDISGKFTVIATFMGTNSYYSSYAETAFGVSPTPTPTLAPQAAPDYTPTYIPRRNRRNNNRSRHSHIADTQEATVENCESRQQTSLFLLFSKCFRQTKPVSEPYSV